jgi:hypothetical protein
MKKILRCAPALALLLTIIQPLSTAFAQGTAFTYQGRLNNGTNPATGSYDLTFTLFATNSGGVAVAGPITNSATAVSSGLFTTTIDFGANFPGADRWVEISVRTNGSGLFLTLIPRQKLTPTPYAITAANVIPGGGLSGTYGGAVTLSNANNNFSGNGANVTGVNAAALGGLASSNFWQTSGNSGTTPSTQFLGTSDNQPLEIHVNGVRALRIEPGGGAAPSLAGGYFANSVAGFYGAVIAGGGTSGAANGVSGNYAFIGAGYGGNAGSHSAVVAGAYNNSPVVFGFIGTGLSNTNLSDYSFIGDGSNNLIQASSTGSFIGGGLQNQIGMNAGASVIAGGSWNAVDAPYSTVGGGNANFSTGFGATVGGGIGNFSSGFSTVSGGANNTSSGTGATVGGGLHNVSGSYATVGGGYNNTSIGNYAAVGGGYNNTNSGNYATVPGGELNSAIGDYSFAAGYRAVANHQGSFVWADSQDADFTSTTSNQFNIRAKGGVRLNSDTSLFWGGSKLLPDQGGAIELGDSTQAFAVPYIDFHYGVSSNQDFNVRLINDANGVLTLSGNQQITGNLSFGSATRQMLNLWGTQYGIGVQSRLVYFRTDNSDTSNGFIWYKGGVHNDGYANAGGGTEMMRLVTAGLSVNGTIASSSDRNVKENFADIKPSEVLAKVALLPITSWNYKADIASRHLGPMAQDFYAAFGIGPDDKHITVVDESGVALAAIQGLNQKLADELQKRDTENAELKTRLEKLEQLVNTKAGETK